MTKLAEHIIKIANVVFIIALVTSSCSKDENESEYSTMTAEFCMLNTSKAKESVSVKTDKDVTLSFVAPLEVSWATKADSSYRALLYYNKVENSTTVKAVAVRNVSVLRPFFLKDVKNWKSEHDPIDIAAAWRSANNKWINLNLTIKTGSSDDNESAKHTIGLVCDSIVNRSSGRLIYCSLCHSQNKIPAYYSATAYASIPLENPTDSFVINVTTWKGQLTKQY